MKFPHCAATVKVRYSDKSLEQERENRLFTPSLETEGFYLETLKRPPHVDAYDFDAERRLYNDTTTWLAEVLPGVMQNTFEYRFDGEELYADDESGLRKTFDDAVEDAERLARYSPNLKFELRRRLIEREEYEDMLAMMRGELPNTMIIVSDFPAELMDGAEDVGGYNIRRRTTMLRVIARTEDGSLTVTSQSLDGSERTALEKIYKVLGFKPTAGELLGQRMHMDAEPGEQGHLASSLRKVYDTSLKERYGGEWFAGQLGSAETLKLNTYDFVCSQTVLLEAFEQAAHKLGGASEELLYNLAAEMERRFNDRNRNKYAPEAAETIELALMMMIESGAEARVNNKTFSGCGMSLGSAGQNLQSELAASGYGNKTDKETKYNFNKYMHCVVCQAPPHKGAKKKMCGPCGICKGCDRVIRAKKK